MLHDTNAALVTEIQRCADTAKQVMPEEAAAIDRAVELLYHECILPPAEDADPLVYTVLDGQGYDIAIKPSGALGDCSCQEETALCTHRAAVRLYIRSHAALQALFDEDVPALMTDVMPLDEAPAWTGRSYPEMPFSVNTFLTIKGRRCQVTIRSTNDDAGLARFEAILERYPDVPVQETPAPRPTAESAAAVEETPAVPVPAQEPASRDDWCTFHQKQMHYNDRGLAHKVGDRLWCSGHWCAEHDTKFWENTSKDGKSTYYSHALQPRGSGTCYEQKRARG